MINELPYPSLTPVELGGRRIPVLTDEALLAACGVKIAFTGREGGVSEGPYGSLNAASHVSDNPAHVAENRRIVLDALGCADAELIVPNQVHGNRIVRLSDGVLSHVRSQAEDGADGLVIGVSNVVALLNSADCILVIIVSPSGRFAIAHAGWRGAVARIASAAARALAEGDPFAPSAFNAYIGPHIRSECFEVGEEVSRAFADEFAGYVGPEDVHACEAGAQLNGMGSLAAGENRNVGFAPGGDAIASEGGTDAVQREPIVVDSRHVSLAAAVSADLVSAGLIPARIADAGICTVCHADEYFSYRASGGVCGRNAAMAVRLSAAKR